MANRRAAGTSALPVLARLVRAAVNDALATYYTAEAARVGFASEQGLAMVDAAHRCEARAERSTTAAFAFARVLASSKPTRNPLHDAILAAGEETDDGSDG